MRTNACSTCIIFYVSVTCSNSKGLYINLYRQNHTRIRRSVPGSFVNKNKKVDMSEVSYNIFLNKTIGTRSILLLRQPSTNRDSTYFHILLFYISRKRPKRDR